jgi:serine/threonine-protein phosphatase PGAM5
MMSMSPRNGWWVASLTVGLLAAGCVRAQQQSGAGAPHGANQGVGRGVATRTLLLIRHGAYENGSLTPLGVAQARIVAERVAGWAEPIKEMTASTVTRAQETASVMHETLKSVPLASSDLLRECAPPSREDNASDPDSLAEGKECKEQLDQAFAKFFVPAHGAPETDVLVAHGNVIRYLVTKAMGVDTKAWIGMSVAHASLTMIQISGTGAYEVITVGDVGHLPPNMQSGAIDEPHDLKVPGKR